MTSVSTPGFRKRVHTPSTGEPGGSSHCTSSMSVLSCFSCIQLFVTPWTVAHQTPLSMEWSSPGKNTGVGCLALLPGIFLTQGSNSCLLCLLPWQMGKDTSANWEVPHFEGMGLYCVHRQHPNNSSTLKTKNLPKKLINQFDRPNSHSSDFLCLKNFYLFYLLISLFLVVLGLRCHVRGFSSCGEQELLSCGAWVSHCRGFSCY